MNRESDTPPKRVSKERSVFVMTRKSFILRLVVMVLAMSMFLPSASASTPLEASVFEPDGELQTIYVTWQYPIPSSEKGDKLNASVGVLLDGKTYASQDVFDILGIPKCPECPHCKGVTITVDGETGMYYPLRESAEQSGYSVLWAPNNEENGQSLNYWVYIAEEETGASWVRAEWAVAPDGGNKSYSYFYAHLKDGYWCVDWGDKTERIPKESATVMEQ